MPNQIKPEYETIIYNYIIDYPTHGPRRIAYELKVQGILISKTGVYLYYEERDSITVWTVSSMPRNILIIP